MSINVRLDSKRWGRMLVRDGMIQRIQNVEYGTELANFEEQAIEIITIKTGEGATMLFPEMLTYPTTETIFDDDNPKDVSKWQIGDLEIEKTLAVMEAEDEHPREVDFSVDLVLRNNGNQPQSLELIWKLTLEPAIAVIRGEEEMLYEERPGDDLAGREIVLEFSAEPRRSLYVDPSAAVAPASFTYDPITRSLSLVYAVAIGPLDEQEITINGRFFRTVKSIFGKAAFLVSNQFKSSDGKSLAWEAGMLAASGISAREMVDEIIPQTGLNYLAQIAQYPHHRGKFAQIYTPLFWFEDSIPEKVIETLLDFPHILDNIYIIGEVRPLSELNKLLSLIWYMRGKGTAIHIFTMDGEYILKARAYQKKLKLEMRLNARDQGEINEIVGMLNIHDEVESVLEIRQIIEEDILGIKGRKVAEIVCIPRDVEFDPDLMGRSDALMILAASAAPLAKYLTAPLLPLGKKLTEDEKFYLKDVTDQHTRAILVGKDEDIAEMKELLTEAGMEEEGFEEISEYGPYELSRDIAMRLYGQRLVDILLQYAEDPDTGIPEAWNTALVEVVRDRKFRKKHFDEAFAEAVAAVQKDEVDSATIVRFYAEKSDALLPLVKTLGTELESETRAAYRQMCLDMGLNHDVVLTDIIKTDYLTDVQSAFAAATYAAAQGISFVLTEPAQDRHISTIISHMDTLIHTFDMWSMADAQNELRRSLYAAGGAVHEIMPDASSDVLNWIQPDGLIIAPSEQNAALPYELMYDGAKDHFIARTYTLGRFAGMSASDTATLLALSAGREEISRSTDLSALVFFNPTEDLDQADKEGRHVKSMLEEKGIEVNDFGRTDAREQRYVDYAPSVDVLHYAGHGDFDAVMPLSSRLLLADQNLTALDILYKLKFTRHPIVYSNACISGRMGSSHGLANSFLKAGAPNYLGSLWPISDVQGQIVSIVFYAHILNGYTIGQAVRAGKNAGYVLDAGAKADFTWVAFILYGDSNTKLIDQATDEEECEKMMRERLAVAFEDDEELMEMLGDVINGALMRTEK